MVTRSTVARIAIGILLGVVLGVVIHESNTRNMSPNLRAQVDSSVTPSLGNQGCCQPGGICSYVHGNGGECDTPGYTPCGNVGGTCATSSSTPYFQCNCGGCVSSGGGQPGLWGNAYENDATCGGECGDQMGWPEVCFGSSSVASVYCCSFDGAGCIQAPGDDPGNDACDQNNTGFTDNTCEGACFTSSAASEAWCCNVITGLCENA